MRQKATQNGRRHAFTCVRIFAGFWILGFDISRTSRTGKLLLRDDAPRGDADRRRDAFAGAQDFRAEGC